VGITQMTDMATTFSSVREESRETSSAASVTNSTDTTLITEQQVLFNTAAAVALPPAKTGRWSDMLHAASAVGTWLSSAARPPKPVYPRQHVWLQTALMSREMDRL
jgi:hypothetical protein